MGFSLETSVPVLAVFVQGLLSFFSPCVLPLIPLYVGYLAGGAKTESEDGRVEYPRKKVLVNTLFFVVGVSFAFFLLGFGFTALGRFFTGNQRLFAVAAGVVMVVFGLYMLGVFGKSRAVETERRLPFRLDRFAMNPLIALVLGFTFSFAWTPCVGPVLTSVLLMASSSSSAAMGFVLIGVYTVGFVLPFLAVGLFTGEVLRFFRNHGNVVQYTVKVGGALLIAMGILTATGWMNGVTGYLSSFGGVSGSQEQTADTDGAEEESSSSSSGTDDAATDDVVQVAPQADLVLVDQQGVEHRLSDYRGKTVLVNFFTTWCGPCQREIPDLEALYRARGENAGEVVVVGVANPKTADHPTNADVSEAELGQRIEELGITYPVLMDTEGTMFSAYGVRSYPTTFMIGRDGAVFGYVSGMLTADMMNSIVEQAMTGNRL